MRAYRKDIAIQSKCPILSINSEAKKLGAKSSRIISKLNYLAMKYLGKYWIFQYIGPVYPGIIAHFANGNLLDKLWYGQKRQFYETTVKQGKSASAYFLESGINEFAKENGGICTFRVGLTPAIYQNTNLAIISDEYLAPSTSQNSNLFGEFMGTLPVDSRIRKKKRAIIESILGNASFMDDIRDEIEHNISQILANYDGKSYSLDEFCMEVVGDIDSLTPGMLDFTVKPLSHYFNSEQFKRITSKFFDVASDVISKLDKNATKEFDTICEFVRTVLKDNYQSVFISSDTNIVKRYFKIWELPYTLENIDRLSDDQLKELGTIIVAIYDTTSLSLSWAISYIEQNHSIKKYVIDDSNNHIQSKKLSYIDFVVFEAVRLGGSNPTALWRKVETKFELQLGENKIMVLPGTMIWLDRRSANQDSCVFKNPSQFDPKNIKDIVRSEKDNISSLMSKDRYEINSFSMINTKDNPRKCPARIFSVYIQSLILRALYSNYTVKLENNNTTLKDFCAMPKQSSPGVIKIKKNKEE